MSTLPVSHPSRSTSHHTVRSGWAALVGGAVFLVAYLAVGFAQGALSNGDLPLPDAPAADTAAYLAANPVASYVTAGLQALSVVGLAVFVASIRGALGAASAAAARLLNAVGLFAVVAMLVSVALTCYAALTVDSMSLGAVDTFRMASFYAGGVAHVVALGVLVFGASRVLGTGGVVGRPTKWFGYVAGALAMLSILSLAIYYANAFLPVGRVLSMVWTVVAAIVLIRRASKADARTAS